MSFECSFGKKNVFLDSYKVQRLIGLPWSLLWSQLCLGLESKSIWTCPSLRASVKFEDERKWWYSVGRVKNHAATFFWNIPGTMYLWSSYRGWSATQATTILWNIFSLVKSSSRILVFNPDGNPIDSIYEMLFHCSWRDMNE